MNDWNCCNKYGPVKTEAPQVRMKTVQRYQEWPSINPEPGKVVSVKPQIKEEDLRTLQWVSDIMIEYHTII